MKDVFTAREWVILQENAQKTEVVKDLTAMTGEAEIDVMEEETKGIDMTEWTGTCILNLDATGTEITEAGTEKVIEMIVETVLTGIVKMKEIVIDMRKEDVVQDLTQVPDPLRKAVTGATNAKRKRTKENVQEAD